MYMYVQHILEAIDRLSCSILVHKLTSFQTVSYHGLCLHYAVLVMACALATLHLGIQCFCVLHGFYKDAFIGTLQT